MSRTVLTWLAVLLIVMGGTGIWWSVRRAGAVSGVGAQAEIDKSYLKSPPDASQKWLSEFTLTAQSGKPLRSKELAGQVYVTNFFFSSCPGTCLQQNFKIREIAQQYGPRGVRFISISCDPEIDTPDRLKEYAGKLSADLDHWSFLTGELLYTRRIAGEIYGAALDKQTHKELFYVTDKWGKIRGHFAWNKLDEITQLKLLLDRLLAETAAPPAPTPDS